MHRQEAARDGALLERGAELERVREVVRSASGGSGRSLVIEGAAGIGKTALSRAGCELARRAGMRVLEARAVDLEREFGFGVVRQLFEPLMRSLPRVERDELLSGAAALARPVVGGAAANGPAEPGFPVLHGLYWLLANLAERDPLLLVIDDAQWSDVESLRFAAFLLGRLSELPVALVMTRRTETGAAPAEPLARIVADQLTELVRPGPLSVTAVGRIIERRLGSPPADEFTCACHASVSGNPLLLEQLLAELAVERIEPTVEQAERVGSAVPSAVAQMMRMRFASLPAGAPALARAVAVLGDGCELRVAAELAGMAVSEAGAVADQLAGAEVLEPGRPLAFVHPIVREAVYRDLAPGTKSAAHASAVRLLREDGAASERLAAHLLATDATGDPQAVELLRAAARGALEAGASDSAVSYLRRALAEPPPVAERGPVLAELGRAQLRTGNAEGSYRLLDALALTEAPAVRAELATDAAFPLVSVLRFTEALTALRQTADDVRAADPDAALLLDMRDNTLTHHCGEPWAGDSVERVRVAARRALPGRLGRIAAATAAYAAAVRGESAAETIALAERALDGADLEDELAPSSPGWIPLMGACACCDLFEPVDALLAAAVARFRRRGSVYGVMQALLWRSHFRVREGSITAAVEDAREMLELVVAHNVAYALPAGLAVLVDALTAKGAYDAAEEALARAGAQERPGALEATEAVPATMAMGTRGLLRLCDQRPEQALEDLLDAGRRCERVGIRNPARMPWRSNAALAQRALGTGDHGRALAQEELARARAYGAPRALGIALRASGLVEGGGSGIVLLREAVGVLAGSGAELEHARALIDLGTTLHGAGRASDARDYLRPGLAQAHACGAYRLADHARDALVATGARPRRIALIGAEALTGSERRVALLAAEGRTNVEIAQTLFVTLKTVEAHLSHAYGKLSIASRAQLPGALAGATAI